jgi:hypothetical protein
MYMKLLMPVIECGVEGRELPFTFDTGATGTFLTIRYFREFRAQARGWKEGENVTAGGGGAVKRKVYLLPKFDLKVGSNVATIRNVPVSPTSIGSNEDELYGNLGQDMVAGFESFTLDFSKMRFTLGNPLQGATHVVHKRHASVRDRCGWTIHAREASAGDGYDPPLWSELRICP